MTMLPVPQPGVAPPTHVSRPRVAQVTSVPIMPTEEDRRWLADLVARGRAGRFTESHIITPSRATLLLERNFDNRPISPGHLHGFEADLVAGIFDPTNTSILLNVSGDLMDGQHRLTAIRNMRMMAKLDITLGAPASERALINRRSKPWSAADMLKKSQLTNRPLRAAVANLLLRIEGTRAPSANECAERALAEAKQHGALMDVAIDVGNKMRSVPTSTVAATAYYWISRNTAYEQAVVAEFFRGLDTGEALVKPRVQLREWLKVAITTRKEQGKGDVQRVAVIINCWNTWVKRRIIFSREWAHSRGVPQVH